MNQQFKPITIAGINSQIEIEFDINLVMKMYHAYIAYLPIERRLPSEQLQLAKLMLSVQDLYNEEQAAAVKYIQEQAAKDEAEKAGIDLNHREKGPDTVDDLLERVRRTDG